MRTEQLRSLWQQAFGDTEEFLDLFFSVAFSPRRCCWLEADGQITAALYWFDCEYAGQTLAYLYAVATHPDHRGRGLCRQLMADAHAQLAALGYAGALLVPQSEALRQMYRRLGYRDCTAVSQFSCQAKTPSHILSPIGSREYALLRREYAPKGTVIQEEESLRFLEKLTEFYQGPGLLLAASREDARLFAPEFFGDPAKAPGVLSALGCTSGTFRTPGNTCPFAMFYPLSPQAQAPSYFAFAFD